MFQDVVYAACTYVYDSTFMFQDMIPWLAPLHWRSTEVFESSKAKS